MISLLTKTDQWLATIEKFLIIIFTGSLTIILMAQVILRYGFSRPLFWAEEISVQLLVFLTIIGMSILIKEKRMIAIDFVVASFSLKVQKIIFILLQVLGVLVIGFFAYQSTLWILRPEVWLEMSPTTQLPVWINYAVLPLSLYGMSYHLIVGCISSVFYFNRGS